MEIVCLAFLRPPLGDLGAMYDDHLRLIGKRVVDLLLALIELFSVGVTAEAIRAIISSKSAILLHRGLVDPKFQVEGVPHQPFFLSVKSAKLSFVWYSKTSLTRTSGHRPRTSVLTEVRVIRKLKKVKATVH